MSGNILMTTSEVQRGYDFSINNTPKIGDFIKLSTSCPEIGGRIVYVEDFAAHKLGNVEWKRFRNDEVVAKYLKYEEGMGMHKEMLEYGLHYDSDYFYVKVMDGNKRGQHYIVNLFECGRVSPIASEYSVRHDIGDGEPYLRVNGVDFCVNEIDLSIGKGLTFNMIERTDEQWDIVRRLLNTMEEVRASDKPADIRVLHGDTVMGVYQGLFRNDFNCWWLHDDDTYEPLPKEFDEIAEENGWKKGSRPYKNGLKKYNTMMSLDKRENHCWVGSIQVKEVVNVDF